MEAAVDVDHFPRGKGQQVLGDGDDRLADIADAAGVDGMVGGQVADVESEGMPAGEETLEYIHEHKTGALIRASAQRGALLGGGSEDDIDRLVGALREAVQ